MKLPLWKFFIGAVVKVQDYRSHGNLCYLIGRVTAVSITDGIACYHIRVLRDFWNGNSISDRLGKVMRVPVDLGARDWNDRLTICHYTPRDDRPTTANLDKPMEHQIQAE